MVQKECGQICFPTTEGKKMKASVVIPAKNGGQLFKQVVQAVLSQQTPWPFEVIVVDSGSIDGTVEFVRSLPRVKLIEIPPRDFGHGRTRNFAISHSQGEFIAMLTHDALPTSSKWLTEMVTVAEADPNIAGVFGRHIAYPNASPFTKRELEMHFSGFESMQVARLDDPARYASEVGYRQVLHFFSDNNALLRRSVWEKIPYPDVDFAEDQAWAKQIVEAGYSKAYAHQAAVYHSHDYALFERLQRSFDESLAFNQLFGYRLCAGPRAMIRSWLALTARDLSYAKEVGLWRSNLRLVLLAPLDNLMRLLGHYFGTRGERLPKWAQIRLSRDKRMMAGLLSSNAKVHS
jgi:rhamnosyltransferase